MKFAKFSVAAACIPLLSMALHAAPTEQEALPQSEFHDKVIRTEFMQHIADTSSNALVKEFASAAKLYYNGEWDKASEAYDALLGKDASLNGNILLREAKIKFNMQDYNGMRTILAKSATELTSGSFENTSLFMRTEAAIADSTLSDKAKADSIEAYLNKYQKGERSTALRFKYAKLSESIGNFKAAKKAYMRVLAAGGAKADSSFAAVRRLRDREPVEETAAEKWAYTKLVCNNAPAEECLALIDSIIAIDMATAPAKNDSAVLETAEDSLLFRLPPSNFDLDTRKSIWEKRAVALRGAERFEESYRQFRFLIDSVECKALWINSALKLLRKNEERNEKEIAELDAKLAEVNKFGKENANNLWLRGFEFEQKKKYTKAIECYRQLANAKFGSNNRRQWAMFRVGLVYVKMEKYAEAEKAFKEAKKLPFTWSANGAMMFLGDVYAKQGKDSLAREAYLECIKDFPLGYYAHRSRLKLEENKLLSHDKIPYVRGTQMSEADAINWVKKHQSKKGSYAAEPYTKVEKLLQFGFADDAIEIFQAEFSKNAKRLDFLFAYGSLFTKYGETALAFKLARAFQNNIARQALADAPMQVLHFLYPVPYKSQVKKYARDQIDPFFVYSVMRQESIFDFQIASPVGARGLLQIMPATGKNLAKLEEIENFNPDMLYNGYMNIRLGIRYLIDLKHEYKEDYMYVLSNYNAGPKPAKRWQREGEGMPWDIRAEDISYWETRDYVKRCMGNYWIYTEIYDSL